MAANKNNNARAQHPEAQGQTDRPDFRSRAERIAAGQALRDSVPRGSQAEWKPPQNRRDPIALLEESNQGRMPELVPIRYGRMLRSPFNFLRGSAALMASDLATTPRTGIRIQLCGDCHLLNFGLFATPERNLVFDINDFDETLPAPWEWDIKRLAVSFVVAGRDQGLSDKESTAAAVECARAYREHLRDYSRLSPLEVWYERLDARTLIELAPNAEVKRVREQLTKKARQRVVENLFPKIAEMVGGRHRLLDQPPVLFHATEPEVVESMRQGLEDYRLTLSDERRSLLDRYRLEDYAIKVVGIGSVGTRCIIMLFFSEENHPLILQAKEARPSVLEPFAGKSAYDNQGQRIVMGQRLMQSSSDIFLGWVHGRGGKDFYFRQLRDMKMSVPIEGMKADQLHRYAGICGWCLARAHAKSGDAATISGYLGKSDSFDQALGGFALIYADQNEQDYAKLVAAERDGRVEALIEEAL